jgi:hypothetical protein
MTITDPRYVLGPELALSVPASFAVKTTAQTLSGSEAGTGAALSVLIKSSVAGAVGEERLVESAVAMLQKRFAAAERAGVREQIAGRGWHGHTLALRAQTSAQAPVQIVLTTLICPDPVDAGLQRNIIVVLEVPRPQFDQRPVFYRRFAEDRLVVGTPISVAPQPLALELEPLEEPEPEPEGSPLATASASVSGQSQTRQSSPMAPSSRVQTAAAPAASRRAGASSVAEVSEDDLLQLAARGQKVLVYSIVLSFIARAIVNVPDVPVFMSFAIPAAVLFYAVSGVLKIGTGFGYSMHRKLALMFFSSVPVLGIVSWIYLSIKTTRRLRAAGYEVGLFGVRS